MSYKVDWLGSRERARQKLALRDEDVRRSAAGEISPCALARAGGFFSDRDLAHLNHCRRGLPRTIEVAFFLPAILRCLNRAD